jgi:hypothetical protein
LPSRNQSGVQLRNELIPLIRPVLTAIRATVQFSPRWFDTPQNHWPSGDQKSC